MERLTYDFAFGGNHCWQVKGSDDLECREVCERQGNDGCKTCPIAKTFDRLAAIEDILGDEYDLEMLRELVEADKTLKWRGNLGIMAQLLTEDRLILAEGCPLLNGPGISLTGLTLSPHQNVSAKRKDATNGQPEEGRPLMDISGYAVVILRLMRPAQMPRKHYGGSRIAEYIEREKVIEMLENACIICDAEGEYDGYCTEDIDVLSIPAADVAPVVRCRECKNLIAVKADNGDAMQVCKRTKSTVCFDDFCSRGEKAN